MATRELKTRFKLEGEQTFRKAMTDAATSVKVLNAEQKLAKAMYEATGDAQQYAADQARILKEQIEEQKKAVAAAEEAVKKLTENGVSPNAKIMQKWRSNLNSAKASLLQMQSRLDNVGTELSEESTEFGNAETAANGFNNEMKKVGKGIDWQNTITAIDNTKKHIEAVVKMAANASKAVWGMEVDAGKWADDLATAARMAEVDPETYQSWQYASMFIDTSVDDIVKSWQDIDKKLDQSGDSLYEYLGSMAQAGIAVVDDATGAMRRGKDIFWDTIDYLHGISDEGKRSAEAMRLFGNDWRKLNPLISSGSAAYKELAEEGMRVAVVSNEQVDALGEWDDQMNDLNARFAKLKYSTLAEMTPTFEAVAEAMSTAVTALNEFIQSEEGQEALQRMNEALQGIIGSFLGEDGGKEKFEKLVNAGTTAVEKFSDAMEWIGENGDKIARIITGMGIAWAGLTATKEVLLFMQLLQAIPLKKLQTLFGGGSGAAQTVSAGGEVAKTAVQTAAKTVGSKLFAAKASSAGAVVAAALAPALIAQAHDRKEITELLEQMRKTAEEEAKTIGAEGEAALQVVSAAADALGVGENGVLADTAAIEQALKTAAEKDASAVGGDFLSPMTRLMLEYQQKSGLSGAQSEELLYAVMEDAIASLTDPRTAGAAEDLKGTLSDAMDSILECKDALEESPGEAEGGMYALIRELANNRGVIDSLSEGTRDMLASWLDTESGFGNGSASLFSDSQAMLDAIFADMETAFDKAKESGGDIPEGYAAGIDEGADAPAQASENMAQGTIDAAKAALDSHSPSRVFEEIGGYVPAGMANGIYERGDEAIAAALWMAESVKSIVQSALQIHSPSRVFEQMGQFTGMGYALGLEECEADVSRAVDTMLRATARRPAIAIGGVSVEGSGASGARVASTAGGSESGQGIVHVTLEVDGEVLGDVMAPIVNAKIGAKIEATRR